MSFSTLTIMATQEFLSNSTTKITHWAELPSTLNISGESKIREIC